MKEVEHFIDVCNEMNKKIWIRQVIVPGIMDNYEYMDRLVNYLQHIHNVERVDFLPAPILVCPTSEFPICPLGNPTSSPLATNLECG